MEFLDSVVETLGIRRLERPTWQTSTPFGSACKARWAGCHATISFMMRRSSAIPRCQRTRPSLSSQALVRSARGGLLLFLAGSLATLAGTPANLQDALQAQRVLVAENPSDADLLNDLGNLLALAGDLEEAKKVYLRALEIDPDDIASLYNLALVLMEQGRAKPAQKTLHAILELEPQHAWAHYQLGTLFDNQNNRTKAVHHYAEAFAIDRSLTSPKVNPHIVENPLATDALLKVYVEESPSTQAPRMYEKPGNVAELLLPRESAEPTSELESEPAAAPEAAAEPPTRRHRASYPTPTASDEDSHTISDGAESRSDRDPLEESDSPPSPTGEDADSEPSQASPRRLDSSSLESLQSRQTGSTGDPEESEFSQSTSGGDPFESTESFIPGVQSTGRLDIELLPAAEVGPAVSPT